MTHTLHRKGTKESLSRDIILLVRPAKGINSEGSAQKLRQFIEIAMTHNPVNLGMSQCGNIYSATIYDINNALEDNRTVNVVFDNKDDLVKLLTKLKETDLGLSVTCAGLYDVISDSCKQADIVPHSVNFSLGVFGRTENLPDDRILEFTTMCGHHQIAPTLVEKIIDEINAKRLTPKEAAVSLARHCPCGIFNVSRAEWMFNKITEN